MKQIPCYFLVGWMMALAVALPQTAQAARTIHVSDSCLDSMETVPVNDDLEPVLIALESCPVPQTVISI